MKLLVDSHILVWLLYEPERFSDEVKSKIESADVVHVSVASLWELAEQNAEKKLIYAPEALVAGIDALGLTLLDISQAHTVAVGAISDEVKDTFDRMLIAQGKYEGCTLVTANKTLLRSGYETLAV
jgi:PIN domain nuclease of toxin-antitoxin system